MPDITCSTRVLKAIDGENFNDAMTALTAAVLALIFVEAPDDRDRQTALLDRTVTVMRNGIVMARGG